MRFKLHIGLSKTATTSLQRNALGELDNYFGWNAKPELLKIGRVLAARLRRFGHISNQDLIAEVRPLIVAMHDHVVATGGTSAIFSDEALGMTLAWRYATQGRYQFVENVRYPNSLCTADGFAVPNMVNEIIKPIWQQYGDVDVMVTLRNQADWVPSIYAQYSSMMLRPDQTGMEQQIGRILDTYPHCLKWSVLVGQLQGIIDDGRLEVGLFETIGAVESWEKARQFFELDPGVPNPYSALRQNVRSKDGEWYLRPKVTKGTMLPRLEDRFDVLGFPKLQKNALLQVNKLLIKSGFLNFGRGEKVVRTAAFDEKIRANVAESNKQLSAILGADLEELGYFVGD